MVVFFFPASSHAPRQSARSLFPLLPRAMAKTPSGICSEKLERAHTMAETWRCETSGLPPNKGAICVSLFPRFQCPI